MKQKHNLDLLKEIVVTATSEILKHVDPERLSAFEDVIEFRNNLTGESDRGIALMGTAYIDERLAVLLKTYLVEDKKIIKIMFDFTGPLGTFSSRLSMAYSLGLIAKNIYDDCNILKKIRNDVAHVSKPISFDDEPIYSRCHALTTHGIHTHSRAKARFTRTIMSVLLEIETAIREIKRCTVKENFDVSVNKKSMETVKKFIKENGLEFEGYEEM